MMDPKHEAEGYMKLPWVADFPPDTHDRLREVIESVIHLAVKTEREACAKIAEEVARGLVISTDHDRGLSQASTFIADAIRARGQTT